MHTSTGQWLAGITKALFAAEERRLNSIVSDLNRKNCEALNKRLCGFRHQGMRFVPWDLARSAVGQPLPALAPELAPQAESLIRDTKQITEDRTMIRQLFVRLLDACNTVQEIRDALPDCVAPLIFDLDKTPRSNPDPLWSIRHDERAVRQYTKLISRIEMYAVTRMLY